MRHVILNHMSHMFYCLVVVCWWLGRGYCCVIKIPVSQAGWTLLSCPRSLRAPSVCMCVVVAVVHLHEPCAVMRQVRVLRGGWVERAGGRGKSDCHVSH